MTTVPRQAMSDSAQEAGAGISPSVASPESHQSDSDDRAEASSAPDTDMDRHDILVDVPVSGHTCTTDYDDHSWESEGMPGPAPATEGIGTTQPAASRAWALQLSRPRQSAYAVGQVADWPRP